METEKKYWFPAKRYGWGWGAPCAWQGWVVFMVWLGLYLGGACLIAKYLALFIGFTLAMGVVLLSVCWAKGEPPRWRWGDDKRG